MSLIVETINGVTTLTLDRPEVHNAFDELLIAELTAAFKGEVSVKDALSKAAAQIDQLLAEENS